MYLSVDGEGGSGIEVRRVMESYISGRGEGGREGESQQISLRFVGHGR